jgi:hypothetical protein
VVVGVDDGDGVHACVDPTSSSRSDRVAPLSDPINCIFLFKKSIVVTGSADISRSVTTMTQ